MAKERQFILIPQKVFDEEMRWFPKGTYDMDLAMEEEIARDNLVASGLPDPGENVMVLQEWPVEMETMPEVLELKVLVVRPRKRRELEEPLEFLEESTAEEAEMPEEPPEEEPEEEMPLSILKYAKARRRYLEEQRPALYRELQENGTLEAHLREIDRTARERVDRMVEQMKQRDGVTEEMKLTDQLGWVQAVNSYLAMAEEFVMSDLVCQ